MPLTPGKAAAMKVAAQLTMAATEGLGSGTGSPRVVDPTLADPVQRAINLEVWEIFRAFYAGIVGAAADDTDWVPPTEASGGKSLVPSGLASALTQPAILSALTGNPILAPFLAELQKLVPLPAPTTPPAPLPNPGGPVVAK